MYYAKYSADALKNAWDIFKRNGVKMSQLCIKAGEVLNPKEPESYYGNIRAKMARRTDVSAEYLKPLFNIVPDFESEVIKQQQLIDNPEASEIEKMAEKMIEVAAEKIGYEKVMEMLEKLTQEVSNLNSKIDRINEQQN